MARYGVVVSPPTTKGLRPEIQGSPKIHAHHLQGSELRQEGDHPIMQGQEHLCLQLE